MWSNCPGKTLWHLVDFKWSAGNWSYKEITECPGSIFVNDINGHRKEVKGYTIKWADDMRMGKISKYEAWFAIQSTIWKTLEYLLPAVNLSKQQCKKYYDPIQYGLPTIGVCNIYPRKLVFASQQYFGSGFKHIFILQEISHLKILCNTHTDRLPQEICTEPPWNCFF